MSFWQNLLLRLCEPTGSPDALALREEPSTSYTMPDPEKLIPLQGGYRKLKSFQVAQLAYDVTVRF